MHFIFLFFKYTLNSITLLLIMATIVGYTYLQQNSPIEITHKIHQYYTQKYNLPPHHFTLEKLTPTEAKFTDIHINDPEIIHIDHLSLHYYPAQLYYEQIAQKLIIEGAELNLHTKNNVTDWGNITKFIEHLSKKFPPAPKSKKSTPISSETAPFQTIELRNALFTLTQESQQLHLPFSLTIKKKGDILRALLTLENSDIKLNDLNFPSAGTLSIDTQISGSIPITWKNRNIIVKNGKLTTQHAGKLIFNSTIPMQDPNMQLLMKALKNFNYEKLTITLNTQEDQRLQAAIAFEGKNIDVYGERDINLNVNVFVDVLKTLKSILGVQALSDKLSESLSHKKGAK